MWDETLPKDDKLIISRKTLMNRIKSIDHYLMMASTSEAIGLSSIKMEIRQIIELADKEMKNIEPCDVDLPRVDEDPYFFGIRITKFRKWNPKYNQEAECVCGDPYHRHFDSYEGMDPIGCKDCEWLTFEPKNIE
jgi:hypothetical protein